MTVRYPLLDDQGQFTGRAYLEVQPAFLVQSNTPILAMHLIARGQPVSADTDGVMQFFGQSRAFLNQLFDAATTTEMKRQWGTMNAD